MIDKNTAYCWIYRNGFNSYNLWIYRKINPDQVHLENSSWNWVEGKMVFSDGKSGLTLTPFEFCSSEACNSLCQKEIDFIIKEYNL